MFSPSMFGRRLAVIAALIAGLAMAGCSKGVTTASSAASDDMTLGSATAKVRVVEYASASCSHCATFNNDVFPAFKAKYIDTGQVHYTLKEFLTAPKEISAAGFLLARCAGKDRYFPVLDAVFRKQEEMFRTGDFQTGLLEVASRFDINEAQFQACLADKDALKALDARAERHVRQDRIESTPTFIINGQRHVGAMTLPELDAAVLQASK
jgi:protein-disulfide isomerase